MTLALYLLQGSSLSAQARVRGFFANFSVSVDHTFKGDSPSLYLSPYDMGLLTSSDYWFAHQSLLVQAPSAGNPFDVYMGLGVTVYPFKNIFSITGSAGISVLNITLNHFAYTGNLKAGVDIPVFRNRGRFLSFVSGLRHRNGIPFLDYIDISDDYFKERNTFFFEMAYRIKM